MLIDCKSTSLFTALKIPNKLNVLYIRNLSKSSRLLILSARGY